MPIDNFDKTIKRLISEFEVSGQSIDDFIVQKLRDAGHSDAEEAICNINTALKNIDEKFKSLQKFKEDGGNREEWLRQELDEATRDFSPEQSGLVLSSAIKVLDDTAQPDEDASYDALDAVVMIQNIDDALVRNTCKGLEEKEEK